MRHYRVSLITSEVIALRAVLAALVIAALRSPMDDARRAVVYHAVAGVLGSAEVPMGMHDLAGVEVLIRFPEGAAIHRGKGHCGDGHDEYRTKPNYAAAATRFVLDAFGLAGADMVAVWREAIQKAIALGEQAAKELPPEYQQALDSLGAEVPTGNVARRKTAAKRLGLEDTEILISDPKEAFSVVSAAS